MRFDRPILLYTIGSGGQCIEVIIDGLPCIICPPYGLKIDYFEVAIDRDLIEILDLQAQQQGLEVGQLVNTLLRLTLKNAA